MGYARWILEGFLSVADQQPHWVLHHEPDSSLEALETMLDRFQPDALLCESRNKRVIDRLVQWDKPVVFAAANIRHPSADSLYRVRADNREVGMMGFHYLRERGFKRFLFAGYSDQPFSVHRQKGFQQAAEHAGCSVETLDACEKNWDNVLRHRLQQNPVPMAVMAAADDLGIRIIHAGIASNLSIPEQLAVLGVDNHAMICRLCHPTLSSIDPGTERIGETSANLLKQLLNGTAEAPSEIRVKPVRTVTRASTDVLSTDDPNMRRVYAFIRDNTCEGIAFSELVKLSNMSRRGLENKYKLTFGMTLGQHMTHVRVARARELLECTDMVTPDIAAECGWPSASHMSVMFKRFAGISPSAYRKATRGG